MENSIYLFVVVFCAVITALFFFPYLNTGLSLTFELLSWIFSPVIASYRFVFNLTAAETKEEGRNLFLGLLILISFPLLMFLNSFLNIIPSFNVILGLLAMSVFFTLLLGSSSKDKEDIKTL